MPSNFISIITPSYNRENELITLYNSILKQNYFNIHWIVIDDGSTDNTFSVVRDLINNSPFQMSYLHKTNGGKLSAQHLGYQALKSDFFFVIDSDDILVDGVLPMFNDVIDKYGDFYDSFIFNRVDLNLNTVIGDSFYKNFTSYYDLLSYVKGDKVHLLRSYMFLSFSPVISLLENYISVAQIYIYIAPHYKLKCFNLPAVRCEYLDSGLTMNMVSNRRLAYNNTRFTYESIFREVNFSYSFRFRACINYYRFSFTRTFSMRHIFHFPCYIIGFGMYLIDNFSTNR